MANELQQAVTTIADGAENGSIQQGEGTALQAGLLMLAAARGLSPATTPPSAPPAPGAGHGRGHGGGHGG